MMIISHEPTKEAGYKGAIRALEKPRAQEVLVAIRKFFSVTWDPEVPDIRGTYTRLFPFFQSCDDAYQ
jgi:hypothetical protein